MSDLWRARVAGPVVLACTLVAAGCGGSQTVLMSRPSLTSATSFPESTTASLTTAGRRVRITEFPGPRPRPALLCCIVSNDNRLWFGYIYADGRTDVGQMTTQGVISGKRALSNSGTMDLAVGPQNGVAYSTINGLLVNTVGLVTDGGVTSKALRGTQCAYAFIVAASDGNLWTCGQNGSTVAPEIDRVTTDGTVTPFNAFPAPGPKGGALYAIARGADGDLWYVGIGSKAGGTVPLIGRMTPAGDVRDFSAGAQRAGAHSPVSIVAGPDGALWFTDPNSSFSSTGRDAIGRITTAGAVREYVLSSAATLPTRIASPPVPTVRYGSPRPRCQRSAGSQREGRSRGIPPGSRAEHFRTASRRGPTAHCGSPRTIPGRSAAYRSAIEATELRCGARTNRRTRHLRRSTAWKKPADGTSMVYTLTTRRQLVGALCSIAR